MDNLNTTAPVTAPAANTPAQAPKAPAKANGAKAPAKGKAPAKAAAKAPAPVKRSSRVEPIQTVVLALLAAAKDKNGLNVAVLADKAKATEREVRLAIDRARGQGFKGELLRTVKNHFALTAKGKGIAAKLAAKPAKG